MKANTNRFTRYVAGYNFREKANIAAGAVMGAAAPIVGLKYMLTGFNSQDWVAETIGWTCSVIANLSPIVIGALPVPAYTGLAGGIMGGICAEGLKGRRLAKESKLVTQGVQT